MDAKTAETGKLDLARAEAVADWIVRERPELTFGAKPSYMLLDPGELSLADLESHGRAGNAVLLTAFECGDLWWCDPEGRIATSHRFAIVGANGISRAWICFNAVDCSEAV